MQTLLPKLVNYAPRWVLELLLAIKIVDVATF